MSIEEKAAQMVQADSAKVTSTDMATYRLGAMLSGAGSDPPDGNSVSSWASFVSGYLAKGQSVSIPVLYGIDAVHGNGNVSGAVVFPHNIGLGCTRNPTLVQEIGRITALEMRGTGVNWTFAPVVGPGRDERWGRTYETYSEAPALAAQMAEALVRGLQGESLTAATSVLACGKHFAGDGVTDGGINEGDSSLNAAAFQRIAIDGYQPAINAGLGSIMVSYSSYHGTKMSAQRELLTDQLKVSMGFRGFLVSDWAAVQKLSSQTSGAPTAQALALAVNAGLDMIMEPALPKVVRDLLVDASTKTGNEQIPIERIDDAVTRILTIKCEMGMFDPSYQSAIDATLTAQIGSVEHRAVARQAVRESLVLLKNEGNVLPIPKTARLLLAGSAADSEAKQCGGWTIDWNGIGTSQPTASGARTNTGTTPVTTIRQAIESVVGASNIVFASDGVIKDPGITHAIVVIGESPYAETTGDTSNLTLAAVSRADAVALDNAAKLAVPVVVIVISGRPLVISTELSKAGAWLAAWLPGSEGDGVADVVFGDYAPNGKLSHSWPASMAQVPINVGDMDYVSNPPLFEYGFGLTYVGE